MENSFVPLKGSGTLAASVDNMTRDNPSSLNPLDFSNTHSQGYYQQGQMYSQIQQQQQSQQQQQQQQQQEQQQHQLAQFNYSQNQTFPFSTASNVTSSHLSNNNLTQIQGPQVADSAELFTNNYNPNFNPMFNMQEQEQYQQQQQSNYYPSSMQSYQQQQYQHQQQPWQNQHQQNEQQQQLFTVNPAQSQELSLSNQIPLQKVNEDIQREENNEEQVYERFLDMCATMIQKFYRGFAMRKKHFGAMGQIERFNSMLWAVVSGWRIRRIFRLKRLEDLIGEIKPILWKRRELIRSVKETLPQVPPAQQSQFMYEKEKKVLRVALLANQSYRFLSSELESVQKELSTTIHRLAMTGLWVFEDKHYKRSISTIVSSFTVIDQSKRMPSRSPHSHIQMSQKSGAMQQSNHQMYSNQQPQYERRSSQGQFATPVHSQVFSPTINYTLPHQHSQHLSYQQQQQQFQQQQFQQQQQQQQQQYPYQQFQYMGQPDQSIQLPVFQHYPSTTPPRISFSNYYPDALRAESNAIESSSGATPAANQLNHQMHSQMSGQFGTMPKETQDISRQLAFNNNGHHAEPSSVSAPKQFVNAYQRSQTLIAETPEQALLLNVKIAAGAETDGVIIIGDGDTEGDDERVKASKKSEDPLLVVAATAAAVPAEKGFNWDDIPVGGGKKKFSFDEYPDSGAQEKGGSGSGHVIKTDIKPTIPKSKRTATSNAAAAAAAAVAEEKKKKEAKPKPFVKSSEESRDEVESVKRSSGYRSQVEIPLVYTGTLPEHEGGTKKAGSREHQEGVSLTKEELAEKDKHDRKKALSNLKKRMKYDPRKAILNEKNGRENAEGDAATGQEDEGNATDVDRVSVDSKPREKSANARVSRKKVEEDSVKEKEGRAEKGERKSTTKKLTQIQDGSAAAAPPAQLKKSTRGVQGHKLTWKNIESRVDCWSSWNKRSKMYEQTGLASNTPKKRRINLSQQQNVQQQQQYQQQMQTQQQQQQQQYQPHSGGIATSRSNEFSFVQGKLSSVSEAQQFQQKVRNKFGLNGGNSQSSIPSQNFERFQQSPRQAQANFAKQSDWLHSPVNENTKNQILEQQPASSLKLPNFDYNSLQNMTTGDLLKLREALVPIIQTNLIFVEQNDPKIFTKIAKEILKFNNN